MNENEIMAEQVLFAGDKRLDEVINELVNKNKSLQSQITALTNRVTTLENAE